MPGYATLSSTRTTTPDPVALVAAVKTATSDPTAVLIHQPEGGYRGKKAAPWSAADLTAAQNALDTVAEFDAAAADIDQKALKAVVLGIWEAIPSPTLTKVQLRNRILAIWRGL